MEILLILSISCLEKKLNPGIRGRGESTQIEVGARNQQAQPHRACQLVHLFRRKQLPFESPHATADVQNFAEIGERRTAAGKFRFPNRSRFINPRMKKLEPLWRIAIRFRCHVSTS